jgi:phosphomannomutase
MLSLISHEGKKFSEIVDEFEIYPASGELNYSIADIPGAMQAIKEHFTDATSVDELDGLSIWYTDFWINVRSSKTEPLLRLNVEADNSTVLKARTDELVQIVVQRGGILK